MNDTVNTAAANESSAKTLKVKTVIDDLDSRRLFDSTDDAANYIAKAQEEISDFGNYPVAAVGFTDEGDFDPEVYTNDFRVAVSVLTRRGEGAGKSEVVAIVIYPSPKLEAILALDAGTKWLTAILEKELNHVAVRNLRKAESESDIADAIESIPTTVLDFIISNRETSGGILEVYNTLWQLIKKALGTKFKAFALANLSKKELRKAIESASYASAIYPKLEDRQNKKTGEKESFFEIAANFGILLAKEQALDPAFFEKALANRNETNIAVTDDDEDFNLEELAAAMSKPESDAPAPDANATGTEGNESSQTETA